MGNRTRFGPTIPILTYRTGYDPADELQQVPDDEPPDLAANDSTVVEVARQVDVVSPVSDLALGITPTAFGAAPTWTNVANLTDGNDTGTFASGPNYVESGTVDKGFSIDLGSASAVASMNLRFTPYAPAAYFIESSPDNTTWTNRPYTRTGPVGAVYTYTLTGGPITARYWRIRRSYHGFIGPQRLYTWSIAGSTTTSSDKVWFGTDQVNDGDDATYEPSDGVDEVLRVLFDIDQRLARVVLKVGSEFSGSVTYELQHATALDFSDASTDATVTLTTTGSYTLDTVTFTWEPTAAYSLWQVVSSEDENRRFYTIEMYETPLALSEYQLRFEKDQPNGYAGLDAGGLVPVAELPNIEDLNTGSTDTTKVYAPDGAGGVTLVTPASGSVAADEDGASVVGAATAFDFRHGLDVTAPGGGVARVAVDEAELTYGAVTAQTTFGLSSANGSAGTPAHSDHTHGTPAGNIEDIAAASTDATKVFAPDGAGGIIARDETAVSGVLFNTQGEEHVIQAHGSMGTTETMDLANGNVHSGILDANCTITLQGFTAGKRCVMQVPLAENGTGGYTPTFTSAGTIVWVGGTTPSHPTTPSTVTEYLFWSDDGGTTIYAGQVGNAGGALTPSAFTFPGATSPAQTAEGQAVWDTDDDVLTVGTGAARKTLGYLGTTTPLVESGTGTPGTSSETARTDHVHPAASATGGTGTDHHHVAQEEHTSDGASTTFVLDEYFDEGSVTARNQTTGHWLSVTETLPDTAVISAAGTAGDVIAFAYAATVI